MRDYKTDYHQSLADTRRALALLQKHSPEFGNHPVEMVTPDSGDIATMLDIHSGIDAYQLCPTGIRGIACRAQRGLNWRTFTIRESRMSGNSTEYAKRLKAILHKSEGYLYPHFTMHAYLALDGSEVNTVGLCKTEELYVWVHEREKSGFKFDREYVYGASFLVVKWDLYRKSGNYFYEYAAIHAPVQGQTA